jgi:hypothetical protein
MGVICISLLRILIATFVFLGIDGFKNLDESLRLMQYGYFVIDEACHILNDDTFHERYDLEFKLKGSKFKELRGFDLIEKRKYSKDDPGIFWLTFTIDDMYPYFLWILLSESSGRHLITKITIVKPYAASRFITNETGKHQCGIYYNVNRYEDHIFTTQKLKIQVQ